MKNNTTGEVRNNEAEGRFELAAGDGLAVAAYRREGKRIVFTHTEVPEEVEGQGFGSRLAKGALDYARAEGLEVAPLCEFIAAYIRRHEAYAELVPEEFRDRIA